MSEPKPLLVIWNKKSNQSANRQSLQERLQNADGAVCLPFDDIDFNAPLHERYRGIVAAGGDGTIQLVSNALLESDQSLPLGIIPLGTGNDLCRTLQIPLQPVRVVDAYLARQERLAEIDVMKVSWNDGSVYSLNVLAAGVSAKLSEKISRDDKETFGSFAYLSGAINLLSEVQEYEIEYQLDKLPAVRKNCLNFFFANGRMCGGGIEVSPESLVDDGVLQLVIYEPMNSIDRAVLLTDYLVGRYVEHPAVRIEPFKKIRLTTDQELPVSIDGEIHFCKELTAEILPRKMNVLLPEVATAN